MTNMINGEPFRCIGMSGLGFHEAVQQMTAIYYIRGTTDSDMILAV